MLRRILKKKGYGRIKAAYTLRFILKHSTAITQSAQLRLLNKELIKQGEERWQEQTAYNELNMEVNLNWPTKKLTQ